MSKYSSYQLYRMIQLLSAKLTLVSEGESNYDMLLWETAERGEFSIESLLISLKYLQPVNEDYDIDLTEDGDRELYLQQTIESLAALEYDTSEYEQELYLRQTIKLLHTFDAELTEQKAYRFGLCSIDLYFIGTTPAGDRICLSGVVVET